ncbi:hypothetical protein Q1695_001700 [Nippostrongylus brasiliensis]|nr:hypothetical protein Q1695_001700 [Nippostrongylus brasiliensis]
MLFLANPECIILYLVSLVAVTQCLPDQVIGVLFDDSSEVTERVLKHLIVATKFYKDVFKLENVTVEHVSIRGVQLSTVRQILSGVDFLICICRSEHAVDLVFNASQGAGIPTIQIVLDHWILSNNSNGMLSRSHSDYIYLAPSVAVFSNIVLDVFPYLRITTAATVIFDGAFGSLDGWINLFTSLPIHVEFLEVDDVNNFRRQFHSILYRVSNIFLIMKTASAELLLYEYSTVSSRSSVNMYVLTLDITPLRCDYCNDIDVLWIRPFPTGRNSKTKELCDYLRRSDAGIDLNYKMESWTEIELSFVLEVVSIAFEHLSKRKLGDLASSAIEAAVLQNSSDEYGSYKSANGSVYFQDIQGRVYRILKRHSQYYSREIAFWTILRKIVLRYEKFDVDVTTLKHYRVVTLKQPPFVQTTGDPERPYEGYCIDLIELIRRELNFTYSIYEVGDGAYGTIDCTGNWNGLMRDLVSGSADIALAPLSVTAEREDDVDFTVPYYDLVGTTIMMRKDDVRYSLFKFMKVLEWPVWLCILAAYLCTSLTLWLFDRFSPYSCTNSNERYIDGTEDRIFSFKECLWFCMTSLTPQGGGEAPKNISGRLVVASWWLFGFIIIASYTANLAAFLTVSRLEQPISSLDDLAKQFKIEYAPMKGSSSENYFRRMAEIEERFYTIWREMSLNESMSHRNRSRFAIWDYPVSDKFTNMWRYIQESTLPSNIDEAIERVLHSKNGFAYIGDATAIKYACLRNCQLQQVGPEFSRKPYAIAVRSGDALKDEISRAILLLLNERQLEVLKEKWWNENPRKSECPQSSIEKNGISIENIGGVFVVILCGVFLSLIVMILEYFCYRVKRSRQTTRVSSEQMSASRFPFKGASGSRFTPQQ